MSSEIERAAIRYGHRAVMLLGKRPAVGENWPEWDATPENIRAWIREHGHRANANVGIRTGHGLVVIDVDVRDDGNVSLQRLEQQHGQLPPTAEVATGGGGRHLYFKGPADLRSRNLRHQGIPGVEIKAAGAQVVAPPSVHPDTGREYAWIRPPSAITRLPGWVALLAGARPNPACHAGRSHTDDSRIAELVARDPLHQIPPHIYVPRMVGRPINHRGFVACPIHGTDTDPSLKVYDDGWYCFGCGIGGRIYQLCALLGGWPLPLNAEHRRSIRELLTEEFYTELAAA